MKTGKKKQAGPTTEADLGRDVDTGERLRRVCLCGRPNVGKSSLFNRLVGRRKALVLDEPGVTRDVYRARVDWEGQAFELADLAGLEMWENTGSGTTGKKDTDARELRRLSVEAAVSYLKTVDLVLFVVDARSDLTPADEALARLVRAQGRPVLVVLSKAEGELGSQAQSESAALGWGEALATSAEHNRGIEDLKLAILSALFGEHRPKKAEASEEAEEPEAEAAPAARLPRGEERKKPIRMGVYGKPNVGKSTLVNALLNERRMITSPIAGTTVDTVDSDFQHNGRYYRILDTAGIRRRSRTEQGVEVLSVVRALKSIADVDVALFLIDGYEGVTDQDEKIAGEILRTGKPVMLVVNKWDLCGIDRDVYAERVRETLPFFDFAPILFVSAEKGEGIDGLFELMDEMLSQRMIQVPTAELNRFIETLEGTNNPTDVKLYYASQTSRNPPTITLMVSDTKKVHFAYERFIKNALRSQYGWMGSPLRLIVKARKRSPSKKLR